MKTFPFYRQPDSMDCGPTCLRMIASYYGKNISLQNLRERTQIGKEGVNMLGISIAAESIGFRTRAVRLNYTTLIKEALLPCILYWSQGHFVVFYKAKRKKLFVADPSHDLIRLTRAEFVQRWLNDSNDGISGEGIALLLEPSIKFHKLNFNEGNTPEINNVSGSRGLAFKNIINYILPYRKLVIQLFIGLFVGCILQLMFPFLAQSVVDVGVNSANIHFVYIVLFAQIALFIGRMMTDLIRNYILLHISTRINVSILTDFFIKLLKLPSAFFDSKRTGDILQRVNDHQRIESFLTGSAVSVILSTVNLIIFSVVLSIFNTTIFIIFAVACLLYSGWAIAFLKYRRVLDYRRFEVASKTHSATIQIVQGMQEIKLNGVERSMRWNWEKLQAKLFKLNVIGFSVKQWQQSGASFINEGKNIFIIFVSAKAVIEGQMSLGSMLAVQYIVGQLNSPIEQLVGFVQSWQDAKISMDRLNEIHKMEDEEPEHSYLLQEMPAAFTKQLVGGNGTSSNIVFSDVSFTYPGAGNEAVLRHIDLKIPKGKTTAIVGVSGSGKTTLLKLLLKFYEPQRGDIKLDGISLAGISHKIWRSHCGVVMQESFIFSDTIERNIAVGVEVINRERFQHALSVANASDFIDALPLGIKTKIGVEGSGISMGQKQRILIARAVYRDPEVILFDEATNSLDANNESVILHRLESFLKGRTVIVVAHRLSTVRHADQIVVLNKGSIVELGTHRKLVEAKGAYYQLVRNQLELGI